MHTHTDTIALPLASQFEFFLSSDLFVKFGEYSSMLMGQSEVEIQLRKKKKKQKQSGLRPAITCSVPKLFAQNMLFAGG